MLNPIQPLAFGIKLADLKQAFGDRLCFYGGVDVQECIPKGTEAEISEQIRQSIADGKAGGCFIIAPAHIVPSETRPENVLAFFHAVLEYGAY